jgi:HD-like signal output (HDOD) protein
VIDQRMREVWAHSTEVSGIAHVLARHYTKLRPDQATLAGIVHQIGVLPILTFAEDNRRLLKDTVALDELITSLHPLLGRRILEAWNFPEELCVVPQEHVNFGRSREKPDYSDVVMVANLQSYIGTDHPFTQLDWTMISAFDRLGLEPEVNTMEAEDLTADMEAAMAFLQ